MLDAAPQWPLAVASLLRGRPGPSSRSKSVETQVEREKLTFRIKVQLDPELLRRYEPWVKVGLPGVAYVKALPPMPSGRRNFEAREPAELLKVTPRQ